MTTMPFFLISLVPLLLGNELAKQYGFLVFLALSIWGFISLYFRQNAGFVVLVSPNALVFFYISLSLVLGSWGFAYGYSSVISNAESYNDWQFTHYAIHFLALCLAIQISIELKYRRTFIFRQEVNSGIRILHSHAIFLVPLALSFIFPFSLNFLGGDGDLSHIPRTVCAFVALLYGQKLKSPFIRVAFCLLIVGLFATFSIHDKREALFLIFPFFYLEFLRRRYDFNNKTILLCSLVLTVFLGLLISMSVARGYGGEAYETIGEALPNVYYYILSENFISGFLANIEVTYFFFHAVNSIELVILDPNLLSYGTTLIKPLFIFFPRSLFEFKPDSIISLYTMAHDPEIRAIGGSWPITIFSEFFWNFHFFGIIFVPVLALILVRINVSFLKAI